MDAIPRNGGGRHQSVRLDVINRNRWSPTLGAPNLENGGTLEKARQMAAHASARTTQLYDRREDRVTPDEVVKINIPVEPSSPQKRGLGYLKWAT